MQFAAPFSTMFGALVLASACTRSLGPDAPAEVRVAPLSTVTGAPALPSVPAADGVAPPTRPAFDALPEQLRRFATSGGPACRVEWAQGAAGQAVLGVGDAHVAPPDELLSYGSSAPLLQLPYNATSILLTYVLPHRLLGAFSSKLWLLECTGAHRLVEVYSSESSDFSFVVTSSDSRWLYHSNERGLVALDLATLHEPRPRERLVAPRTPEYRPLCWSGSVITPQHYLPVRWVERDRVMWVRSEAGCGFESEAESWPMLVSDVVPDCPPPRVELQSPVATVRSDAQGELWLGDGERCDSDGVRSPSSRATLWRSKDGGASWAAVEIHNGNFGPSAGVVQLEVQGGVLVALTGRCESMIPAGGDVWWSRDRGKTWQWVAVNEEVLAGLGEAEGALFEQIEVLSSQPLRVRAFRGTEVWEAKDDGGTRPNHVSPIPKGGPWKPASSRARPARSDHTAQLGATTFLATTAGLARADDGQLVFRTLDYLRAFHFRGHEDAEPGVTLPLRPVAQPWRTGCHSRRELEASGELGVAFKLNGNLSVFGVQLSDRLNLRVLPSVDSQVLTAVEATDGDFAPSGNACRVAGDDWVQLQTPSGLGWANARYLRHLSEPRPDTARVRGLLGSATGTPAQQGDALRLALTALHAGQEGARSAELLGVQAEKDRARAVLTAGAASDDSISGQVFYVDFVLRGKRWQLESATVRDVCSRGLSADGRCI